MRADRPEEMMKLGAFFHPTGNHVAAWLHPEARGRAVVSCCQGALNHSWQFKFLTGQVSALPSLSK
jgi:hypothetical protein